ncbi:MAG: NAD(P)/FAD-dependent oxidoreductase [Bacteroidales bacterium]|nr:NAD(P)/FAD-dependent oxidoreductase [Bacteroidales bacterium]
METREICIVGGGVAGTLAALFLAKKYNIPCTILDKEKFPREKICGDGISGWVVSVLEELDRDLLRELFDKPFVLPSYGIRIGAPNNKFVDLPFETNNYPANEFPPGFVARRYDFDNFLVEKAKAHPLIEFLENTSVESCKTVNNGIKLRINSGEKVILSKLVLYAQGTGSPDIPGYNPGANNNNTFIALRGYYNGITGFHPDNYIELHFLKDILPGYFWIFPMKDGMANVGIGMLKKDVVKKRISLKSMFYDTIKNHPVLGERFSDAAEAESLKAHPIPLWSKKNSISGDHYLVLGDAARLVDPVTGEGMGHAALSGKFAASVAARAITEKKFGPEFLNQYDKELYNLIENELKISKKISRLIKGPFLINTFMKKAERNPWLKEVLAGSLGNLDTRKHLKNPLFYLKMLIS